MVVNAIRWIESLKKSAGDSSVGTPSEAVALADMMVLRAQGLVLSSIGGSYQSGYELSSST